MLVRTKTSGFVETILALDALNSWVRTSGAQCSWGASHVVYWLKVEAIKLAGSDAAHRRVALLAKCRGCGGTGRYVDSCGHEFDHHYECNSKGVVDLEFIETTIALPSGCNVVWHTPDREAYRIAPNWPSWPQHRELSWMPNQPGRELAADDTARLFNLVESRIPLGSYRPRYLFDFNETVNDFATYGLYCGSAPAEICGICGGPNDNDRGFGCATGRAHWIGYACKSCQTCSGGGEAIPAALEAKPPALLDQPNIAAWMSRHPIQMSKKCGEPCW